MRTKFWSFAKGKCVCFADAPHKKQWRATRRVTSRRTSTARRILAALPSPSCNVCPTTAERMVPGAAQIAPNLTIVKLLARLRASTCDRIASRNGFWSSICALSVVIRNRFRRKAEANKRRLEKSQALDQTTPRNGLQKRVQLPLNAFLVFVLAQSWRLFVSTKLATS